LAAYQDAEAKTARWRKSSNPPQAAPCPVNYNSERRQGRHPADVGYKTAIGAFGEDRSECSYQPPQLHCCWPSRGDAKAQETACNYYDPSASTIGCDPHTSSPAAFRIHLELPHEKT
jgi:hypothetical protein